MSVKCDVCFRGCELPEGYIGACKARICTDGEIVPATYGRITALALDPIEKKPLYHFHPGTKIISVGGYGCNLACPFCQNHDISLSEYNTSNFTPPHTRYLAPAELASICEEYVPMGNIGVAFTYNEPTISYEYILDVARLVHMADLKVVLVTNGSASLSVLEKLNGSVDAMNIDLKSFDPNYYKNVLHGDLDTVKSFISEAAMFCHVEVTTLIIPYENDTEDEMREISAWLASVGEKAGRDIPLHISRFFPRSHYADRTPTDPDVIYKLSAIAREKLKYVHEGNV